ncbi:hypothetical protein F4815DRAFT_453469 [Daldinia loculata]|nr:hypothetical protein F4815DRAFT_453469 [Daldinia loculata]
MSVFWGALLRFDPTAISSSHHRNRSDGNEGMRQIGPSSSPPHSAPSGHSTTSHKRNASVLSSSSSSGSPPGAGVTRPRQDTRSNPSLPIRSSPPTSRPRKRISNPDYVDSTALQIGSSSQAGPPTSASQTSEYVDRNTHMEAARGASEDQTVHLLQSFIRSSLHLLQSRQERSGFYSQGLIEVDLIKLAHRRDRPSGPRLSAIDDGGLRLQYLRLLTFKIPLSCVQAIEAGQPLDPGDESHYIVVETTRILNLTRTDDRIAMFRYLGALIQWLKP